MKRFTAHPVGTLAALLIAAALMVACGKESSTQPQQHNLEVQMSYQPNPATINTLVNILFEVEENGVHQNVSMTECEIEKEGSGQHQSMSLTPDATEEGHYRGTWTFTEAGTYEVHFTFMHDNENEERKFEIVVQ